VSFGPFTLDLRGERLLRDGVDVPLTPKVFQALKLLIERPGELVTKEEFLATLWAGTFVEEANLSTTIWMLRRALKDDGQIITTVPKRGYRFSGQIIRPPPPLPPPQASGASGASSAHAAEIALDVAPALSAAPLPTAGHAVVASANRPRRTVRWTTRSIGVSIAAAVSILVLAVVLIAGADWTRWRSASPPISSLSSSITAIAVLPLADLSADGSQRFVADGLTELLITELARTTPIRVTSRTSSR
jgi:DNA-binding winged helix-turn-helix (wHTH) protein